MAREFSSVGRVVVKVGTNLLSNKKGIDFERIKEVVSNIIALKQQNIQVILVSSGAIGLGAKELGKKSAITQIALRQACASIGQPLLMSCYRQAFTEHNVICSQVLITRSELNERRTFVNLRNAVESLLELDVVPIFNENDVVSTAEIGSAFGDNDRMSAFVASKINADLLIILTDIDGLYTKNPKKGNGAQLLNEVEQITDEVLSYAANETGSTFATGGMKTKLLAAKIAANAGCATIIANGAEKNILKRIIEGEVVGTYIHSKKAISQRSRWILNTTAKGRIVIDQGAVDALRNHKSLLPSGIIGVEGAFKAGDVVNINNVAKAVPYYNSSDIMRMAGRQSSEIPKNIRHGKSDVIFRPEDIVFLDYGE
jgi:glutamate 5-kinase